MESGKISLYLKVQKSNTYRALNSSYFKSLTKNSLDLVTPPNERQRFKFQKIFMPADSLTDGVSYPVTKQLLGGSNACIITLGYPQTSPQRCMFGTEGMIQSTLSQLKKDIANDSYILMMSFFKVRTTGITDLIDSDKSDLQIEEISGRSYIPDLSTKEFKS